MGTLNFRPGQFFCFSLSQCCMPLCALTALCAYAMLAWVGAHTVFVSNVSMYQKSVICYLYKTRGLLFQSTPLVSPSISLLCEVSNFSITSPLPVSRRGKRSLSHNFRSPSGFSLLFWEIFFFLFQDSQTISLERFRQIAEEYITPKPVARREPITMLLKSVANISTARLSSPSENPSSLLWWNANTGLFRARRVTLNAITASKLSPLA